MANETKTAPVLDKKVADELGTLATTSAKIRFLLGKGMTRGDVARTLNVRYQHVRNVEITPIKKVN